MKKAHIAFLLILCVFAFSACNAPSYVADRFYSTKTLEEGLVPNLPTPQGDLLYRTGTSFYCDKIYVSSEQTAEEYFESVLHYVQGLDFKMLGTVDFVYSTTGNLFLTDDSYVFKSTKELAKSSTENYYNDSDRYEPYYSVMFTNGEILRCDYGDYFNGTLIRVCMDEKGIVEYDGGSFAYDYFLEVRANEQIWVE